MDIEREVREFIQKTLVRDVAGVSDEASLLDAGIVDSLGVLSLVGFIEERYGITVSDDEMMPEHFDSIAAIAGFVRGRQRAGSGS